MSAEKINTEPAFVATLHTDLFNLSRFSHVFQIHSPIQHITITNLNRHFTFSTYCIKCRGTHPPIHMLAHTHTRYPKKEINIYGPISLNYSFAMGGTCSTTNWLDLNTHTETSSTYICYYICSLSSSKYGIYFQFSPNSPGIKWIGTWLLDLFFIYLFICWQNVGYFIE